MLTRAGCAATVAADEGGKRKTMQKCSLPPVCDIMLISNRYSEQQGQGLGFVCDLLFV